MFKWDTDIHASVGFAVVVFFTVHWLGCWAVTFKMHSACFREQCECIYVKALKSHHLFTSKLAHSIAKEAALSWLLFIYVSVKLKLCLFVA